jgi:hypothetical protein
LNPHEPSPANPHPHPHPTRQLRSLEDHQPLPGVVVGDIGTKFGFNGVDNGFLRLDHVRIRELVGGVPALPWQQRRRLRLPHRAETAAAAAAGCCSWHGPIINLARAFAAPNSSPPPPPWPPAALANMMARFSRVTPEGAYVPPPPANSKASYATMLYVRADIVRNAGELSRAGRTPHTWLWPALPSLERLFSATQRPVIPPPSSRRLLPRPRDDHRGALRRGAPPDRARAR